MSTIGMAYLTSMRQRNVKFCSLTLKDCTWQYVEADERWKYEAKD